MIRKNRGMLFAALLPVLLMHFEPLAADEKKQLSKSAGQVEDESSLTPEELHRKRTREAIRRAVVGSGSVQVEQEYKEVPPDQADKYIGHQVQLKTYFGRKVEGTLKRVEGNTIFVDEHVGQGRALYPIDKTKLTGLKVLY